MNTEFHENEVFENGTHAIKESFSKVSSVVFPVDERHASDFEYTVVSIKEVHLILT